jgi:hypothetical protein
MWPVFMWNLHYSLEVNRELDKDEIKQKNKQPIKFFELLLHNQNNLINSIFFLTS